MALLGQNSVGEPSIVGQYPMFVRTVTHEWTTALKPLRPGTVCFSEGKNSTPNNFSGGILTNAQVRSIMQASECKRSLHLNHSSRVLPEKQVTAGRFPYALYWLYDRFAQKHRFNWAFPLCLVCIDLQFRCMTELTSLNNDQCCGWGCPLTVKKSVFIYVKIVTCNLYKHTSENVWWQYYPKYIALGNDREGGRKRGREEGGRDEGGEGGREGGDDCYTYYSDGTTIFIKQWRHVLRNNVSQHSIGSTPHNNGTYYVRRDVLQPDRITNKVLKAGVQTRYVHSSTKWIGLTTSLTIWCLVDELSHTL